MTNPNDGLDMDDIAAINRRITRLETMLDQMIIVLDALLSKKKFVPRAAYDFNAAEPTEDE